MKFFIALLLVVLMQLIFIPIPEAYAYSNPAAVPLGTVSNFAALAHTTTTSAVSGTALNNGDLGIDADCTGFPFPCTGTITGTVTGVIHKADEFVTTGQTDATTAVTNIGSRGPADVTITDGILGGLTLTQGVYDVSAATTNLTGDLTLNGDANSVFIFRMASTLITANGSRVVLGTGVQACNVFWKVSSSATFDGTTTMVGTVLAAVSATFSAGGATLNGRVIAQTGAITFNNTTVNNSSCATPTATPTPTPTPTPTETPSPTPTASPTASSIASSLSSSSVESIFCPALNIQIVSPIILESRRVSPTSIFVSWGPYSGVNMFNVQYGPTDGDWLYSTDVTGFSTTINSLPTNVPIWVRVGARNDCTIGIYGQAKFVGGPVLPGTGFAPRKNNISWYLAAVIFVGIMVLTVWIEKKIQS